MYVSKIKCEPKTDMLDDSTTSNSPGAVTNHNRNFTGVMTKKGNLNITDMITNISGLKNLDKNAKIQIEIELTPDNTSIIHKDTVNVNNPSFECHYIKSEPLDDYQDEYVESVPINPIYPEGNVARQIKQEQDDVENTAPATHKIKDLTFSEGIEIKLEIDDKPACSINDNTLNDMNHQELLVERQSTTSKKKEFFKHVDVRRVLLDGNKPTTSNVQCIKKLDTTIKTETDDLNDNDVDLGVDIVNEQCSSADNTSEFSCDDDYELSDEFGSAADEMVVERVRGPTRQWSNAEVEKLVRLVNEYKSRRVCIPWVKIAKLMNRPKIQVYNKYCGTLERKGRFITEEDSVILTAVKKFGKDFKKIASLLSGRSSRQVRTRYKIIAKNTTSVFWTTTEDRKLLKLIPDSDNVNYASLVKYFHGKDRHNIRGRHITLLKWMDRNPKKDIAFAPRRYNRKLRHGTASNDLEEALEKLRKRMLYDDYKNKELNEDAPEELIEDAIIAFISSEKTEGKQQTKEQDTKAYNQLFYQETEIMSHCKIADIGHSANMNNLQKILLLLKSNLDRCVFQKSLFAAKYSGLLTVDTERKMVKYKSYSKKAPMLAIPDPKAPTIWGSITMELTNFVLPPNYTTVIALLRLITYIREKNMKTNKPININHKSQAYKQQMKLLQNRLKTLFLWPIMLTSVMPDPLLLLQNPKIKKCPCKRNIIDTPSMDIPDGTKKFKGNKHQKEEHHQIESPEPGPSGLQRK